MAKKKYTKEYLEPIVEASYSIAEVIRRVGMQPNNGGAYATINRYIRYYKLDTSHFTGRGWAKGKNADTCPSLMRSREFNKLPDSEVFCENSSYHNTVALRRRLISDHNWDYSCSICGLTMWNGKSLTLHMDHINGVSNDHRLENLRFLCPNCHQQTETWGR